MFDQSSWIFWLQYMISGDLVIVVQWNQCYVENPYFLFVWIKWEFENSSVSQVEPLWSNSAPRWDLWSLPVATPAAWMEWVNTTIRRNLLHTNAQMPRADLLTSTFFGSFLNGELSNKSHKTPQFYEPINQSSDAWKLCGKCVRQNVVNFHVCVKSN